MKVLLKPVAQVNPNKKGILAPSRIQNPIAISFDSFMEKYADTGSAKDISLDQDGVSNPQRITTYNVDGGMIGECCIVV